MRVQSLALVAIVSSVAMARADTAELCTGSLVCDAGYCCSSHGFCGRSPMHCSHSSGCNAAKGSCGVVLLDKQEIPHVVSYNDLSKTPMTDLVKRLTDEGLHVSPDEKMSGTTMETLLKKGLEEKDEKEKVALMKPSGSPAPKPASSTSAHPSSPIPSAVKPPATADKAKANGAHKVAGTILGAALGIFVWLL
ncbi:hypothetical protein BGX28_003992 [Mortierella sp. GBA30]|nr:hypothetical protein BGX28_003992 [Mortierella sp. GBA30]